MLLFCLKSVPWTGDELAGDDAENCENSILVDTYISLTSLVILYQSALTYFWNNVQ